MIACICMGTVEVALVLLGFGTTCLATAATHFYNVWKCKLHHCRNCRNEHN